MKVQMAQADVILLQEVNTLPEKAEAYVTALKTSGAQYSEVHQVDACGIRLFGPAIVPGLNNGLAVPVKAPLMGSSSVAESEAVVISAAFSWVNSDTR